MSDYNNNRHRPERIDVPGGWIYFGGPLNSPVLVSDPAQWAPHANTLNINTPDPQLVQVLAALQQLTDRINTMSGSIDTAITNLTAQVAADTSATSAATTMINGFAAQLAAAVAAAQNAGATPAQLQSFTDLGAAVQANADALSAAVTQNTPAAAP
jgi:hypothetical protein